MVHPASGRGSVSLNQDDTNGLAPGKYLNDNIVDFYLKYNSGRMSEKQRAEAFVYCCQFWTKLYDNGYDGVRK